MNRLMTMLTVMGSVGAALLAIANIWLIQPPLAREKVARLSRSEGGKL